jgi:hypothetical protein
MTDLIERAKAALEGVDVFNEWLLFHPIARALIETTADRDHLQAKVAGMQALCDNLAGEVEKAVSERTEELRHQVERYGDQIDTLTAERDALRERVAKLRDALEGIAGYDDPYEPCGWAINTARADLPPTDAECLRNEKVRALVEALRFYGGVMPVSFAPGQDGGWKARAALAALEPTPSAPSPEAVARAALDDLPETHVGEIENYYGGLYIKCEGGQPFWCIEGYASTGWKPCPEPVFLALAAIIAKAGEQK